MFARRGRMSSDGAPQRGARTPATSTSSVGRHPGCKAAGSGSVVNRMVQIVVPAVSGSRHRTPPGNGISSSSAGNSPHVPSPGTGSNAGSRVRHGVASSAASREEGAVMAVASADVPARVSGSRVLTEVDSWGVPGIQAPDSSAVQAEAVVRSGSVPSPAVPVGRNAAVNVVPGVVLPSARVVGATVGGNGGGRCVEVPSDVCPDPPRQSPHVACGLVLMLSRPQISRISSARSSAWLA